ncbi:hypothetical protein HYX02_00130 [Candidatus Woesearchaeota archaeon]|nr:hypothetical protein [Candidatus Woesearchaeota archaeon]
MPVQIGELSDIVGQDIASHLVCQGICSGSYYDFLFYIREVDDKLMLIGEALVQIDRTRKVISWENFYPFQLLRGYEGKKGWGTLAHVLILQMLIENEGNLTGYIVEHSNSLEIQRIGQLEAIGIIQKDGVFAEEFSSYYRKSIDYLRSKGINFKPIQLAP